MAEANERNENFLSWSAGVLGKTAEAIGKGYEALMRDGTLAAAGRQGISELGMALKAFPDAIQVHEVGTLFSPTQGEIAKARETDQNANDNDNARSNDMERERER